MRTIHVLLLIFVVLAAATTARAQGEQPAMMVGMPEYSITLSGSPADLIENHSGRVIMATTLKQRTPTVA